MLWASPAQPFSEMTENVSNVNCEYLQGHVKYFRMNDPYRVNANIVHAFFVSLIFTPGIEYESFQLIAFSLYHHSTVSTRVFED